MLVQVSRSLKTLASDYNVAVLVSTTCHVTMGDVIEEGRGCFRFQLTYLCK